MAESDNVLGILELGINAAAAIATVILGVAAISVSRAANRLAASRGEREDAHIENTARREFSAELIEWFDAQPHGTAVALTAAWRPANRLATIARTNQWIAADLFIDAVVARLLDPDEPVWIEDDGLIKQVSPANDRNFWNEYKVRAHQAIWAFGAQRSDDLELATFVARYLGPM